jgi:hypothetical protein
MPEESTRMTRTVFLWKPLKAHTSPREGIMSFKTGESGFFLRQIQPRRNESIFMVNYLPTLFFNDRLQFRFERDRGETPRANAV